MPSPVHLEYRKLGHHAARRDWGAGAKMMPLAAAGYTGTSPKSCGRALSCPSSMLFVRPPGGPGLGSLERTRRFCTPRIVSRAPIGRRVGHAEIECWCASCGSCLWIVRRHACGRCANTAGESGALCKPRPPWSGTDASRPPFSRELDCFFPGGHGSRRRWNRYRWGGSTGDRPLWDCALPGGWLSTSHLRAHTDMRLHAATRVNDFENRFSLVKFDLAPLLSSGG